MSDNELEEYKRSCRALTCSKADCASFGWVYTTTTGFFYHLNSITHNSSSKAQRPEPVKAGHKRECKVLGCSKYGVSFSTGWNFTLHASSGPHIRAVQHGAAPGKEPARDGTAQPPAGFVGYGYDVDGNDAEFVEKITALESRVLRLEEELIDLRHIKWWLSAAGP